MPALRIRGHYEELSTISKKFARQASDVQQSIRRLKQQLEGLRSGDWIGVGADKFYREMDSEVMPSMNRLAKALELASSTTRQIIKVLQTAENDAARILRLSGLGRGIGAEASGGGGAGIGVRGSPTAISEPGLSAEGELAKDLLNAITTAGGAAGLFSKLKGGERILAIANSTSFKYAMAGAEGVKEFLSASDRGVGTVAAGVDGAIGAAATFINSPTGSVVGLIHNVTNSISPELGRYTAVANDVMPVNVGKSLAIGSVDTVDALVRGDYNQLSRHHDQNLAGDYGEVTRGYAIGFDSLGAVVTGDSRRLNQISDMAADGSLGPLAEFGDWLGGATYDLFH